MKPSRPITITFGAAGLAAILFITFLGGSARDTPASDAAAKATARATRNEVAYPPPLPSYPQVVAAAAAPPGKGELDLCGYGRVNPEQLPAEVEAEADSVILRVAGELARSTDDRTRALGLATRAWIAAQAADRAVTAEDPIKCRETALCDDRAAEAYLRAAQPSLDALVRLATTTRDPHAYVTALRTCRTIVPDSPPAACSALSVEQWAQVDPDNAFAWLLTARNAHHRKDAAAFEAALLRASRAGVFDRRATQHGRILDNAEAGYEAVRTLVVQKLVMADTREDPADYFSNFAIFGHYCAKNEEPGRREVCSNLATVLAEHSPDRLGLEIGFVIALNTRLKRSAGPGQPVLTGQSIEFGELDANTRLARERAESLTCKASAQTEEWLRGVTKFGEVGYLRQRNANKNPR